MVDQRAISHVKKFGNVLEIGLCSQMHGRKAARNCGGDAAAMFGEENDHFVNTSQNCDANWGGAIRESAAGVSLCLY